MMTDEQFIEWLRKIKEHCMSHACSNCPFNTDYRYCQINALVDELQKDNPDEWNIDELERIIRL